VVPFEPLRLIVRVLSVALAPTTRLQVTVVLFTITIVLIVTFVPDTVTVVTPLRSVPVNVTGTVVPRMPEVGEIEVSTAPYTVKFTLLLTPPGVVTVMVRVVSAAAPVIVNVAVTVVELTTTTLEGVTSAPDTDTADVPVKSVPVNVTPTAVPRSPVLGLIEVSVGTTACSVDIEADVAMSNSTASLVGFIR